MYGARNIMYKSYGDKKPGGFKGGKRFGGAGGGGFKRPSGGSFGGDHDRQMYDATCATCSTACQVPFRPNGRKPVLCSNCFKKEGGGEFRSEPRGEYRKPSFSAGPEASAGSNFAAQLKEINDKLDAIIEALEE